MEGYYFGRFQPPLIKHGLIVQEITTEYLGLNLTVGIADSSAKLSQDNFLTGAEIKMLFQQTLEFIEVNQVSLETLILTEKPFLLTLRDYFSSKRRSSEAVVFTGSFSTMRVCSLLASEFSLKIVAFQDDDSSGPRSRMVRQGLIDGTDSWHSLVAPGVLDYLNQTSIIERIHSLPSGEKRPWAMPIVSG